MLHVAFVRSVHAHARILAVDTGAATAWPGVVAVATAADADIARYRICARSALPRYVETEQPVLAWPEARFAGEAGAPAVAGNPLSPPNPAPLPVWSGTEVPHLARPRLAETLGLAENRIRVIAPDVGGGFGVKAILYPEDVALRRLAMRLGRAVKWVEQRREGLVAAAHARDHHYAVRAGFDRAGRLLAMDARIACNAGAYSVYPWTAGLEALMAGGLLAGPYKLVHYRCKRAAVATHPTPAAPPRAGAPPPPTLR